MEATIICLDNSEWMRNGDFGPSRLISQNDAAILLSTRKIDQNAESAVAVISMAGKGPKVLITLSNDDGKLMNAISSVQIEGSADILGTLQLAQLALKHKQNKSQQQRIILFVGSPVAAKTEELVRIAKRLKKNNTAVDVISFGETMENTEKLQSFHDAVNNNDNSALLSVPPGPHNLSDFLSSFPSVLSSSGSSGGSDGGFLGGVDPQMDPELAAALRMSIEESQVNSSSASASTDDAAAGTTDDMEMDDDMLLQRALEMSMQDNASSESTQKSEDTAAEEAPVPEAMEFDDDDEDADDAGLYDDLDEDAQLALAMEISMGGSATDAQEKTEKEEKEDDPSAAVKDALNDPSFMDSIFDNIDGVDANDPLIQSTLRDLNKESDKDKKSDK